MSLPTDRGVPPLSSVLRAPGFAAFFIASVFSAIGDHIARVTIAFVVFDRTGNALATATVFATSLLPTLIGRGLLAPLVDRFHHRNVLITTNLLRAALSAVLVVLVVQEASIVLTLAALFLLELAGGPSVVAGLVQLTAWFPEGPLFTRAFALNTLSGQLTQVFGFAAGGTLVSLVGPRDALIFDCITFLITAVVLAAVVPRTRLRPSGTGPLPGGVGDGLRRITQSRLLRSLILLGLVAWPAIVAPEALAIPYAASHGWQENVQGILVAVPVAGTVIGVLLLSRWPTEKQGRLMLPMALATPVLLLPTFFDPGLVIVGILWVLSGICQSFMLPLQALFSLSVEPERRGRVFGLAGAISVGGSAVAYVLAGWLSSMTTPATAVGLCAVISLLAVGLLALRWPRTDIDDAIVRTRADSTAESTT